MGHEPLPLARRVKADVGRRRRFFGAGREFAQVDHRRPAPRRGGRTAQSGKERPEVPSPPAASRIVQLIQAFGFCDEFGAALFRQISHGEIRVVHVEAAFLPSPEGKVRTGRHPRIGAIPEFAAVRIRVNPGCDNS